MDKKKHGSYGRVPVFATIWMFAYFISLVVIKNGSFGITAGIILSLLPVIAFVFFIYSMIKGVGSMDEVEIRIQMEAVVIAFSLGLLTLMTLGLLDMVIKLNPEDWGFGRLVNYFTLLYFLGLLISKRRYT